MKGMLGNQQSWGQNRNSKGGEEEDEDEEVEKQPFYLVA